MYYGCLPSDWIGYLIQSKWHVLQELPYCLVTSIDSYKDVKAIIVATKLVGLEGYYSFLGKGVLVSGGRITDLDQAYYYAHGFHLFKGYDEVWLYKDQPTLEKARAVSLGNPVDLSTDPPSRELLDWFDRSGCVVGLGDSEGMNYITTSQEIVESLTGRQQGFESDGNGDQSLGK